MVITINQLEILEKQQRKQKDMERSLRLGESVSIRDMVFTNIRNKTILAITDLWLKANNRNKSEDNYISESQDKNIFHLVNVIEHV